jgi:hypothetical protein
METISTPVKKRTFCWRDLQKGTLFLGQFVRGHYRREGKGHRQSGARNKQEVTQADRTQKGNQK